MIGNEEKKQRPQDKWDEKAGLVPKTYKINKEVAEEFKEACKESGVAMGTQLTKLMKQFVEEVNNKQYQRASGESRVLFCWEKR